MASSQLIRRSVHYLSTPSKLRLGIKGGASILFSSILRNLKYYSAKLFNKDKLEPYYRSIFELIQKDFAQHETEVSGYWKKLARNMEKDLYYQGLSNFKRSYSNRHFSGQDPRDGMFKSALWQYYQHVKGKDRFEILTKVTEPDLGNSEYVEFEGKKVTWDYLQSVDEFYRIVDYANLELDAEVTILEVGGGYGRTAYIFAKMMPKVHYVLVDLPNTLIIAYYYFHKLMHEDTVPYETSREHHNFNKENLNKRVHFLLPHQIKDIQPSTVDGYININSFQEMTPAIVDSYLTQFDRIGGKWMYLMNRTVENNIVDNITFKMEDYPIKESMKLESQKVTYQYPDKTEQFFIIENKS